MRISKDHLAHKGQLFFYYLGLSFLLGAIEKQKLVYILNRDAQARLTISSPLEAHKSNTLVYHMVGVDVGFENPTFACLEIDYEVSSLRLNHCQSWTYILGFEVFKLNEPFNRWRVIISITISRKCEECVKLFGSCQIPWGRGSPPFITDYEQMRFVHPQ